ncbi:hypothetical protein PSPO01_09222 [Paraphaeosphaeria sporulosa]
MAPIDDAVAEINSLDPSNKFCYMKIASKQGVERSTLSRRYHAVTQSHASNVTRGFHVPNRRFGPCGYLVIRA